MKPKLLFVIPITLSIFQGCCQFGSGKSCEEHDSFGHLPVISISFKNYPTTNFKVTTYVQQNNTYVDSVTQTSPREGICVIRPYSKERGGDIDDVRTKKFIISRNNKSDTLSQLNCTYQEYIENCNQCNQVKTGVYSNFTVLYKNQVLSANSLTMNY
jgi:hypothetical protein